MAPDGTAANRLQMMNQQLQQGGMMGQQQVVQQQSPQQMQIIQQQQQQAVVQQQQQQQIMAIQQRRAAMGANMPASPVGHPGGLIQGGGVPGGPPGMQVARFAGPRVAGIAGLRAQV